MFLGLDFGTSGARACAVCKDKSIAWELRVDYPDAEKQTPRDWRSALLSLLGALPREVAANLQGIAIAGTSGTVLLCDEGLAPLGGALLYNDARALEEAAQLKSLAPSGHTACSAASGLAKFLWLTQQPEAEYAAYFLHQADWLAALLSGRPGVSDWHNALKTGYDVEALHWPGWVSALPQSHLLPEVLAPGAAIGPIRSDIAARFGISPQCNIHAGTTDGNAAFVATGVNEPGFGVTSLGTTLVLKQLSEKRIEAPEYGIYSHKFGDLWLVGGASNSGAGVLRQFFDDERIAELSLRLDPLQDSPLDYYPLPRPGERFPINDPRLAPRPLRLDSGQVSPRPADDAQFLHGLLQGLTRIEAAGYAKLAELGAPPLKRVATAGGGAKNDVWRKMRERLLGVPVCAAPHAEAAYGCALLCCGDSARPASAASN